MDTLKSGKVEILVATAVTDREVDVENITHVLEESPADCPAADQPRNAAATIA